MEVWAPVAKRAGVLAAVVIVGITGLGYAVHEHRAAEQLTTQNQQETAELTSTRAQLSDLSAKVNSLQASSDAQKAAVAAEPAPAAEAAPIVHRVGKPHAGRVQPGRLTRMQAQLDAQGKEIEATRGDLTNTRTELTGSIARTHDELVVLEKRGERNYFEFDVDKSKQFRHEGPVGISLRKANVKHAYADLQLMVDDRAMVQKHVNLYQPVMFYQSDTEQPIQVVINQISRDHIHGYVSAPTYRKSELASMASTSTDAGAGTDATASAATQAAPRRKLTVPKDDSPQ
ncbi:MAG TPA: hypothetical protein VHX60_18975 [Acidobacteriaceae bacterium]|nr:hypothetical protein [Acidobacteriaceae bacterium]